jgi:hypothetical protein
MEAAAAAAIGKAITKAAAADAADQKALNKALVEAVRDTPNFQKAVEHYGERAAVRQGISTWLLKLFGRAIRVPSEYLDTKAADDLAGKLDNIPDEDLQPPKRSIAAPAFEGLGHVVDEPGLRDLYLELLARAVDAKYADMAHPSFVEVIRQLSAEEAELLRHYLAASAGDSNIPIVSLQSAVRPGIGTTLIYRHLLDIRDDNGQPELNTSIPTYVDNWIRLGLLEVHYDAFLTDDSAYSWVEARPETASARSTVEERVAPVPKEGEQQESYMLDIQKGYMTATSFGKSFALAVGMFGELARQMD